MKRHVSARKNGARLPLRFVAVSVLLVLLIGLSGCTGFYGKNDGLSGCLSVRVSDWKTRAFAAEYYWDGFTSAETLTIDIPDEYKGTPVTALGGYIGTGVPTPFTVVPSTNSQLELDHADFVVLSQLEDDTVINYEEIYFTVNIGKNLKEINSVIRRNIPIRMPDGTVTVYEIDYLFNCSEENRTFYSRDGILYNRSDDKPVAKLYQSGSGEAG
ncbi:MAG: hypothetical protein IKI42_09160 [Clostridia bacterium]|nr:hypothetical protein [Clostridia bacterium]